MIKKKDCTVDQERLKVMLLDMLSWFHEFCVKHDLTYYIVSGTLLGAVRHKGFIPWDDDIDVAMPREDYTRLKKLVEEYPNERYVLETSETAAADFFYTYGKIYDTSTTLVENTRCKIRRGIFLDIFPIDGAGKTKEIALSHLRKIKFRKQLLLTMTTGIRRGRSTAKNLAIVFMRAIPDRIIDRKRLLLSIDQLCRRYSVAESNLVGVLIGNWYEKEIMPLSTFGKPTEYEFENLTVYGVEKADEYLTALYGDWRQLPPVEKRKSHHDFIMIDLEKSYLQ